jgi:hypothetical protein
MCADMMLDNNFKMSYLYCQLPPKSKTTIEINTIRACEKVKEKEFLSNVMAVW